MDKFLIGFLEKAITVYPKHDKAFVVLKDECEHYRIQFGTFTDVYEAISLLCSTPVFVELYPSQYRSYIETLLAENVEYYLHPQFSNQTA